MSDKEITQEHYDQLHNIMYSYDNDVLAQAIFNIFRSNKGWSDNLGKELVRLVEEYYHD